MNDKSKDTLMELVQRPCMEDCVHEDNDHLEEEDGHPSLCDEDNHQLEEE